MLQDMVRTEHGSIGAVLDLTIQRRVHQRHVVALEIVVHIDFPVRGDGILACQHMSHALELERGALRRDVGMEAVEVRGLWIQCRKDHWTQYVDLQGLEPYAGGIERLRAVHLSSPQQLALQAIRPSMIATDDAAQIAAALGQRPRTVSADVEKASNDLCVAQQQQRLTADAGREILAMAAQLSGVADVLPAAPQHAVPFARKLRRIGIKVRRRRACKLDARVVEAHGAVRRGLTP